MRRVMLLALLTLVLRTPALAGPISFITGTFVSGSITSSFRNPFQVQVIGSIASLTLDTSSLTCSGAVCSFTSGTVFTFGCTPDGSVCGLRTDIVNGRITMTADTATITGNMANPFGVCCAGFTKFVVSFNGNTLTSGNASAVITPEPGTLEMVELGLLGVSVIGLAGMARRKTRDFQPSRGTLGRPS